jgi:taurine--2-oxoglutarate transaminase
MDAAKAKEIYDNDRKHVIHSWSIQTKLTPIVFEKAEGSWFWDASGKKYLDMASQLVNSNIGHQHPKVVKAIQEQAARYCFTAPGIAAEPRSTLAKKLSEITPKGINRFFFTNAGADANENAIKIAKMATGKQKVIARYRSYHGATYGAISVTGDPRRPPVEPGVPGIIRVLDPYCYRCPFGQKRESCHLECAKHFEEVIMYENPATIAAFIMETVTGSNGVFVPPVEYMKEVRRICTENKILLICDEVMAGFGRTGTWFAVENFGIEPDILTMAKGINSGYVPLGAVGLSDEVAVAIEDKFLYCGLTYSGHPLACAAAVATIDAYKDEKIIENAAAQGEYLKTLLAKMKDKHPSVGDVRSIGLFGVIEFVKNRETKEPLVPWNGSGESMTKVAKFLSDQGLYMYIRWNYMFIVPPCIIKKEELDFAFAAIDKAIDIADGYVESK